MARYTAAQLNEMWDKSTQTGKELGRQQAIKEIQADLRAKRADAKLKLMQAMGQAMEANATAIRAMAQMADELRVMENS